MAYMGYRCPRFVCLIRPAIEETNEVGVQKRFRLYLRFSLAAMYFHRLSKQLIVDSFVDHSVEELEIALQVAPLALRCAVLLQESRKLVLKSLNIRTAEFTNSPLWIFCSENAFDLLHACSEHVLVLGAVVVRAQKAREHGI